MKIQGSILVANQNAYPYDVSGRHRYLIGPRGKVYWRGPITLEILYVIICVGQPWPYLRYLPLGSI